MLMAVSPDTPATDARASILAYLQAQRIAPNTYCRIAATISAAYKHAEIELKRLPTPPRTVSPTIATPEQQHLILTHANTALAEFLTFLLGTGARPSEAASIERRNCHTTANGVVITLPHHKTTRKTSKPRVLYCNAAISYLIRTLCTRYPTGKLLRTRRGSPWTLRKLDGQWARLVHRIGSERLLSGYDGSIPLTVYAMRHTYATERLASGVPLPVVAELLGHSVQICQRYYSHLGLHSNTLWDAVAMK